MGIILALLGLSFIVFVHELGHAIVAHFLGVRVEVFSIGIGSPYFSFKWGETEIRISPFLFGGYCRMEGANLENSDDYESLPQRSLLRASGWRRILIYLAGPLFNIILAFGLFSAVSFMGFTLPDYSTKVVSSQVHKDFFETGDTILSVNGQAVNFYTDIFRALPEDLKTVAFEIERNGQKQTLHLDISLSTFSEYVNPWIPLNVRGVQDNSPAKLSGLKAGDTIVGIDDKRINTFDELESLKAVKGQGQYSLLVDRSGKQEKLTLFTAMPTWGIFFEPPLQHTQKADGFLDSISTGFLQIADFMKRAFVGIWTLILSPFHQSANISGPIGITGQLASATTAGVVIWVQLLGFISASLAAMNLFFPIPVMDGGQTFLVIIEMVRGKRFTPKTLLRIHMAGLLIVFGLLALGVFNDLTSLWGG